MRAACVLQRRAEHVRTAASLIPPPLSAPPPGFPVTPNRRTLLGGVSTKGFFNSAPTDPGLGAGAAMPAPAPDADPTWWGPNFMAVGFCGFKTFLWYKGYGIRVMVYIFMV